ncbi:MAG: Maf family protein [Betaproteobacteria bacterium]
MKKTIVLASTSPYRRELLGRLGLPFEVADPRIDEIALPAEAPESLALRLSEAKARAVANEYPSALIIGSDQVAFFGGQIFGKPGSHPRAIEQLHTLSGRTVNFFTGLCVFDSQRNEAQVRGVPTLVTFRQLSTTEIENYLQREQPYGCAGSAKSEGLGIALLQKIEGEDPNALIGLPLIALCEMLRLSGVSVL